MHTHIHVAALVLIDSKFCRKHRLKKMASRYLDNDVDIREYPFTHSSNPLNSKEV